MNAYINKQAMINLYTQIPRLWCRYFGSIQQHKPTPIQQKAQKQGIMAKKMLAHQYKMLQSSKYESREQIQMNFIQLKKKLNDRHFYMPRKKQYLQLIDKAYDNVMLVHDDELTLQISKGKGKMSKNQLLTYQLKQIQKAKRLSMFQSYQFACSVQIIAQEIMFQNSDRLSILSAFQTTTKFVEGWENLKHIFFQYIRKAFPEFQVPDDWKRNLQKMGVIIVDDQHYIQQKVKKIKH